MRSIYHNSPIAFACIWISIYTGLLSICDGLSSQVGIAKIVTAPAAILLSIVMVMLLKRWDVHKECGLQKPQEKAKTYLYYIPMFLIIAPNLWWGVSLQMSITETVLYVISMLCVGFLEELIFRGLLYNALEQEGVKSAVLISTLTFGIGHIFNIFNFEVPIWQTLLQVCYAVAAGWMFTIVYKQTHSILICAAAHAALNMLSAFTPTEQTITQSLTDAVYLCVLPVIYTLYLIHQEKKMDTISTL